LKGLNVTRWGKGTAEIISGRDQGDQLKRTTSYQGFGLLARKETSLCEKNVVDMMTYDTKERNPSKEVRYEGV